MNIEKLIMAGPGADFGKELFVALGEMEKYLASLCPGAGEYEKGLGRIIAAGGKRLRPMLAWVSHHLTGKDGDIIPLMCMLELMHTSSLIHDDYVDDAGLRRGALTINAESGGAAAIQSGDYLLAKAMELLKLYRGTGINEALSRVAQEMCLGELDQRAGLFKAQGLSIERYYSRIRRKTALLMAESCRAGVVAAGGDSALAAALYGYGEHLGLAFQLRDDLLDWEESVQNGKTPLQDLRSGVITLPIIFAAQDDEALIQAIEKPDKNEEEIKFIQNKVAESKALERTMEQMEHQGRAARDALSALPGSAEKYALLQLAKSISEVKNIV